MNRMYVNDAMCATCPWRKGSPYGDLRPTLEASARRQASRICHSTGSNAINVRTGKPEMICRGARNYQLRFLTKIGLLREPTDDAWSARCQELGIEQDAGGKR
jgi:hypothetical protein